MYFLTTNFPTCFVNDCYSAYQKNTKNLLYFEDKGLTFQFFLKF